MEKGKKIKVMAYCDSPTCATGFGTVSRNIFEGLYKTGRYDIDVFGINYWGDPHNFPYRIWPAGTGSQDPYGRQKAVNMIPRMDFDILFLLQDSFIMDFLPVLLPHLKTQRMTPFKSILYFPVDSVLKDTWGKNINDADRIVAYSEFGKAEALKVMNRPDMLVIPHGVNVKEYFPLPKHEAESFRKEYFKSEADKFIITNLNRNQQRKDVPRTIQAFKEFRKQVPNSILYLHMAMKDQGWDLPEVCTQMGLDISKDVIFPQNFGPNQGYPREVVNALYNASDVVVSTTLGEGFGLSWVEAMAAKTPVLMPRNTAMTEFITEDRGYLMNSGTNSSLYTVLPHDNEVERPLVDVDDMVKQLVHIYNNRDDAKQKADNAYKWVTKEMDWQGSIANKWVKLFDETVDTIGKDDGLGLGTTGSVINTEQF
jgi:D-inositol-3-phosphate glycosyltransferase